MSIRCSLYDSSGELVGNGDCELRDPDVAVVEMPRARLAPVPGAANLSLILADGRTLEATVRSVHSIRGDEGGPAREVYELQVSDPARRREKRERRGLAGTVRSLFGRS